MELLDFIHALRTISPSVISTFTSHPSNEVIIHYRPFWGSLPTWIPLSFTLSISDFPFTFI